MFILYTTAGVKVTGRFKHLLITTELHFPEEQKGWLSTNKYYPKNY